MTAFIFAILLLLTTPGPGVLSTAGVGAAYGFNAGLRYVTGLFIGTNAVAFIVVSGLAAVLLASPWARTTLLAVSTIYLLYLAFNIAFATRAQSGAASLFSQPSRKPGMIDGILLQLVNPKAYVVNTTLFTGFAIAPDSLIIETLIKFIIINAIWIPIHLLWLFVGTRIQRMNLQPRTRFAINCFMAIAMVAVVVLAVTSSL